MQQNSFWGKSMGITKRCETGEHGNSFSGLPFIHLAVGSYIWKSDQPWNSALEICLFHTHCTEAYGSLFICSKFSLSQNLLVLSHTVLFLSIKKLTGSQILLPPGIIIPCVSHIKQRQKPECVISLFLMSLSICCLFCLAHFLFQPSS